MNCEAGKSGVILAAFTLVLLLSFMHEYYKQNDVLDARIKALETQLATKQ